jgi:hypothetical protein
VTRGFAVCSAALLGLILTAWPARAQTAALPGRFEIGLGPVWTGRLALGSADANETTSTGSTSRLFSTSTELAAVTGIEGRVGVRIFRRLEAEASASYGRAPLRTAFSNDIEGALSGTATESVDQFTIGGGVLWYFPPRSSSSRLTPFVTGGAAYLRDLHEAATLVVGGRLFQGGGGIKYLLAARPASHLKGLGIRVDARVVARSGAVAFDNHARYAPGLGASLFTRF